MSDFWARRKAAVAKEAELEARTEEALVAARTEADLAERSDEELLAEAKLPAPEDLDSSEAVREFMASALPQRLKTRALRKLWTLNPVLANLDGLIDYGEDFTDSATVIENLQTAYQVGKGMLAHLEAMAEAEREEDESVEEDGTDEPDSPLDPVPEPPTVADALEASEPAQNHVALEDGAHLDFHDTPPQTVAASRRMQFRFEEPA